MAFIMHYIRPPAPLPLSMTHIKHLHWKKPPPPTMVTPPLTHPPLGPSKSIHPFTHGCFEAPPPPQRKTCIGKHATPYRKKIDLENMNPPLFSLWAIYLAHISIVSIIVSIANLLGMTFFMHLNFTDLVLNGH